MTSRTVGSRSASRAQGLTLIEMLVTMAVLAAVAALLAPAVFSARGRARGMQCANAFHQIQMAMHVYYGTHRYLPIDSYVTAAGERLGDSQTAHLWSGAYGVKRGLGLLLPDCLPEPSLLFDAEPSWARFSGPAGWRDSDGTDNWMNPQKNVISCYIYRQNFGQRLAREEAGEGTALVTEYTLLNSGRYNHGGKSAHILFADGHIGWFNFDLPQQQLPAWDWFTLAATDPATGASGWETGLDPLAAR